MDELSPRGFASFIAAGLGGFSWVALPWVVVTLVNGTAWQAAGLSGGHLVYLLLTPTSPPSPAGPNLAGWEEIAGSGFPLLVLGSIVYLVGCVLVAVQVFTRWPWGGLVMMPGALMCVAAIWSFAGTYPFTGGSALIVGPSVGLYFGFIAALVSLAPLILWKEEAEWRSAEEHGASLANDFWRDRATLERTPVSVVAGTGVQERATRSYCPTCGRGFYGDDSVCLVDGTPLRPTRADAASPPGAGPSPSAKGK